MTRLTVFQSVLRKRRAIQTILMWLAFSLFFVSTCKLLIDWKLISSLSMGFGIAGCLSFLTFLVLVLRGGFSAIPLAQLARHLNQHFDALQYSTQLLLQPHALNQLESLQKARTQQALEQISKTQFIQTLPPVRYQWPVLLLFAAVVFWLPLISSTPISTVRSDNPNVVVLESTQVRVSAPDYMQLPEQQFQQLNIESWQDSDIEWLLSFNQQVEQLALKLSDGETLIPQWQGNTARFNARLTQSQSYHLRVGDEVYQQGFYSILVQPDRVPNVRFTELPSSTLVFAREQQPQLQLSVVLTDDFGLSEARVRMSLARGSGEAVKFRDLERPLDNFQSGQKQQALQLNWDLRNLEMTPGDELYLSIVAWDNLPSGAQEGKSPTLIVKWLDEEAAVITAEGIVTDLELEYFKSQRQIIIETKQLMQDKEQLDKTVFNETSRQLGLAQSDLKQRYGQYLGDEFEGVDMYVVSEVEQHEDEHEHSKQHHKAHEQESESQFAPHLNTGSHEHDSKEEQSAWPELSHQAGHAHHEHGEDNTSGDLSGRMALISQYGHNHGDADIGPVIKYNPRAYMKRSVEQMWSAELHLMLGEPDKALPFEEEALKYLKLARQADRIYVKRLGFEPPPVSEEKRLTGELDEVLSPQTGVQFQADDNSQALLLSAYQGVAMGSGSPDTDTVKLLTEVLAWIKSQVPNRPALIQTQVQLETILANQQYQPQSCPDCQQRLVQKFWQLLAEPQAEPFIHQRNYLSTETMTTSQYQEAQ